MIRFILDTTTRRRDSKGNTKHLVLITSTMTGRSLTVIDTHPSNIYVLVKKSLDLSHEEIHESGRELPIREYDRHSSSDLGAFNETEITQKHLTGLERGQNDRD